MNTGKSSAVIIGLVGGLALGAWIGGEMTSMTSRGVAASAPAVTMPALEGPAVPAPTVKPRRVTAATKAAHKPAAIESASMPKLVMTIPVSAPELHERMKPVLARGTKLPLAVEGFTSAEQFAMLAHAARNTQVPFILLKHRVLTEGHSLEDAIRASKPDLDARQEVVKARTEARTDIAALAFVQSN
jgi:hypothetical protein